VQQAGLQLVLQLGYDARNLSMKVCSFLCLILALQAGIYHGLAHLLWMTNE